jgi:hypothetical protein
LFAVVGELPFNAVAGHGSRQVGIDPSTAKDPPGTIANRRCPLLLALIPKVFYADINVGLDLFVRGLGFKLLYRDDTISVLGRDAVKVYLMQNAELAALDRPELAIETDDIREVYEEVKARAPDLLHPNGHVIQRKPWGADEFALLDETTVCVVFRQWPAA